MTQKLKEAKRRISSIRHIRKVTTALQKVAATRTARVRHAIEAAELYRNELGRILGRISAHLGNTNHPLLNPKAGNTTAVIVFGSEKGLCGNFNSAMTGKLAEFRGQNPEQNIRAIVVGKVTLRYIRHLGIPVDHHFDQPQQNRLKTLTAQTANSDPETQSIVTLARNRFLDGTYTRVFVVFTRFVSMLKQIPAMEQILPVQIPHLNSPDFPFFEPAPNVITSRLLDEYLKRSIHTCFLNSLGSENAARQAAMSRASENAGTMLHDLMLTYWRLRQENITSEITELARGSAV